MEISLEAGSWWAYVLVFVAAATPVLEVLVVIPAAILAGLSPVPVLVLALAGNLATVALVVLAGERLRRWWRRRRSTGDGESQGRARRARRLVERWGVPGLALLAPITTGTHIAALTALTLGTSRHRTLTWMGGGVLVWAAVATVATGLGLETFA